MEEIKVNLDNLTNEERETLLKLVEKGNKQVKRLIDRQEVLNVISNIMTDKKIEHKHRALNRNIKQLKIVNKKDEDEPKSLREYIKDIKTAPILIKDKHGHHIDLEGTSFY